MSPRWRPASVARASLAAVLGALVVGGVVIGCSRGPGIPSVPTTVALRHGASTTTVVDRSRLVLPMLTTVAPVATRGLPFGSGSVTLTGAVTGPAGPVAGASIRLERVVGDAVAVRTVGTDSTGHFRLEGIAGGRIRIRAWRAPDLAQVTPVVLFASGRATVDLQLQSFDGTRIDWNVAPRPPIEGRSANLVVQLSTRTVEVDGSITVLPTGGVGVTIVPAGMLQGEVTEQTTDASGRTVFAMGCYGLGSSAVQLRLATGEVQSVDPPPCSPVPTTTTTIAPDPLASSTVAGATSTPARAVTATTTVRTVAARVAAGRSSTTVRAPSTTIRTAATTRSAVTSTSPSTRAGSTVRGATTVPSSPATTTTIVRSTTSMPPVVPSGPIIAGVTTTTNRRVQVGTRS